MLHINEIYKSIQGESSLAGRLCVFVRLTGCHLRCRWCDTEHAFYEGTPMTVAQVVQTVSRFDIPLVEVTGGEPLLQKETIPLLESLLERGFTVMLETAGSPSLKPVPEAVIKIMDIKCPGSGEAASNNFDNLEHLTPKDEVKFVIRDRTDYEWSRNILDRYRIAERAPVLFSPVYDQLTLKDLAQWILEDNLPVRLQTQLHKIIWSKDALGV